MTQQLVDAPAHEQRFRMSYDAFLEFVEESTHAEWVDGEVTIFVSPDERHQQILGFLHVLLLGLHPTPQPRQRAPLPV